MSFPIRAMMSPLMAVPAVFAFKGRLDRAALGIDVPVPGALIGLGFLTLAALVWPGVARRLPDAIRVIPAAIAGLLTLSFATFLLFANFLGDPDDNYFFVQIYGVVFGVYSVIYLLAIYESQRSDRPI